MSFLRVSFYLTVNANSVLCLEQNLAQPLTKFYKNLARYCFRRRIMLKNKQVVSWEPGIWEKP